MFIFAYTVNALIFSPGGFECFLLGSVPNSDQRNRENEKNKEHFLKYEVPNSTKVRKTLLS